MIKTFRLKAAKPVTVKAGEVVFSGMYKFNRVKEPLFSMELITRKRSARNYVEKRRPELIDRYRNAFVTDAETP